MTATTHTPDTGTARTVVDSKLVEITLKAIRNTPPHFPTDPSDMQTMEQLDYWDWQEIAAQHVVTALTPILAEQHTSALAARDAEVARKIINEINALYQWEPEIHESEYEKGYWQGIGEVWELVFAHAPKCLHCQGDRTVVVNIDPTTGCDVFEKCPHCDGIGMEPESDLTDAAPREDAGR